MISDATEKQLISTLGWVDKGSLWVLDTDSERVHQVQLSEAKYLSLHSGSVDYFSAVHHFDSHRLGISVNSASEPEQTLAKVILSDAEQRFAGEMSVWQHVSKAYVSYYTHEGVADYWLLLVRQDQGRVSLQRFDWYDDTYDQGYQGIVRVTEVPGQELLIVSVQRDSNPVLYDPERRQLIRKISLAGRGGNPTLRFRSRARELWADDYDTLLKLDPEDWSVKESKRLQEGAGATSQFIGEFAFNQDESLCVVARPYSADVIALDTRTFEIRQRCRTGGQPLQAALLKDGRVFARDWKTGALLKGVVF